MDPTVTHVEGHINDLAQFLFLVNKDTSIYLSLHGLEDNKDMFYFCVDLFSKGLVLLFGDENKVEINSITHDQFSIVKQKLARAGIQVFLATYEDIPIDDDEPRAMHQVNIPQLESLPNDLPLKEYVFTLRSCNQVYQIHFDLLHNY